MLFARRTPTRIRATGGANKAGEADGTHGKVTPRLPVSPAYPQAPPTLRPRLPPGPPAVGAWDRRPRSRRNRDGESELANACCESTVSTAVSLSRAGRTTQ